MAATACIFVTKYKRNSDLTLSTVNRLIKKFRETSSISGLKQSGRPSTLNIDAVRESLAGNVIWRRSQELAIWRSSVQRILPKCFHFRAYEIHLTQELNPTEHAQRRNFLEWILKQQKLYANIS